MSGKCELPQIDIAGMELPGMRRAVKGEAVLGQMLKRAASPGYRDWEALASSVGWCACPVQLTSTDVDGQASAAYSRCNNRRAAVCPSCSRLYGGDVFQLVHAGLFGGRHGIPETVASHPRVFATLTAPSFGKVHTTRMDGQCHHHAYAGRRRCEHKRPVWCDGRHGKTDPELGKPLCLHCYDHTGHALFSWCLPELWCRFAIRLRRLLARRLRDIGERPGTVKVTFVKIAEAQRRGLPHLHAVIRLDAAAKPGEPPSPPTTRLSALDLAELVKHAAADVSVTANDGTEKGRAVRFGEQTDAQHIEPDSPDSDGTTSRKVAGYLAKYVTKSTADFGISPVRIAPASIEHLEVSEHVNRILHALVSLSVLPGNEGMCDWLHTLGYRGHVATKSRGYSTTMTKLREQRAIWHTSQHNDDNTAPEEKAWAVRRIGHATIGDRVLALTKAAQQRENHQAARAALDSREDQGEL
ncbi:replication initiation protein [Segniliparus rotundus DSM 44985]|uniref:Replication initiation protein n=1 Tax=Segniliparus rotundus (strain ATCC BAA-972 / CDC 1076 / CIP 108378 / DSM 44985 / JCM 13578) TaxID=640132 RepID=D6Z8Y4_SEGRD|nr:replication initiator [Segniliparus rotundus]ADG98414.1 replication initiation protein [Segniliparus rotundus DSM 44985]